MESTPCVVWNLANGEYGIKAKPCISSAKGGISSNRRFVYHHALACISPNQRFVYHQGKALYGINALRCMESRHRRVWNQGIALYGIIKNSPAPRRAVFLYHLWHSFFIGHEPQPHPQDLFPRFLSLISLKTTRPITITSIASTANEPRFSFKTDNMADLT